MSLDANSPITSEIVLGDPNLFDRLCEYVNEVLIERGRTGIESLPIGLRRVHLILDLDSEIYNGGFHQYLSNRTDDRGQICDAHDTLRALTSMQADDAGTLLAEALRLWEPCIPAALNSSKDRLEAVKEFATAFKEIEPAFERLDDLWCAGSEAMAAAIELYARSHEVEFVHPAN